MGGLNAATILLMMERPNVIDTTRAASAGGDSAGLRIAQCFSSARKPVMQTSDERNALGSFLCRLICDSLAKTS